MGALYHRGGKRLVDVVLTVMSAPLTVPLCVLGWVLAKLSTGDTGFFTQQRVGRDGVHFPIVKLRTMRPATEAELAAHESGVAAAGTARVTAVGRWLRRTKLDELPQLWNVVTGQMTLVGPRPDVPQWTSTLVAHPESLALTPGMTSLASVAYTDEEELLSAAADPVAEYANVVLPHKLELNDLYARNVSASLDARILWLTVMSVASRSAAQRRARTLIQRLGGNDRAPHLEPQPRRSLCVAVTVLRPQERKHRVESEGDGQPNDEREE